VKVDDAVWEKLWAFCVSSGQRGWSLFMV